MSIKLSVLTCSLDSRKDKLETLSKILSPQMNDSCEWIVESDNREKTVGEKRNILLDKAKGEYVCYVDDDDSISDNYISAILKALEKEKNADCCSLNGNFYFNGGIKKRFYHSIDNRYWHEENGIAKRTPNHLNVIRKSIVESVRFARINAGEDGDFSLRVRAFLKKEAKVEGAFYNYYYNQSQTQTAINREGCSYNNSFSGNFNMSGWAYGVNHKTVLKINNHEMLLVTPNQMLINVSRNKDGLVVNKNRMPFYRGKNIDYIVNVRISGNRNFEIRNISVDDKKVYIPGVDK